MSRPVCSRVAVSNDTSGQRPAQLFPDSTGGLFPQNNHSTVLHILGNTACNFTHDRSVEV